MDHLHTSSAQTIRKFTEKPLGDFARQLNHAETGFGRGREQPRQEQQQRGYHYSKGGAAAGARILQRKESGLLERERSCVYIIRIQLLITLCGERIDEDFIIIKRWYFLFFEI